MLEQKPNLQQIDWLVKVLISDKVLQEKYNMDMTLKNIENITTKQYNYFIYLISQKKRDKLNQLLIQLGFKAKQ